MLPSSHISYEFGGFVLNPGTRELLHFNRPVNLPGRDFDVLLYLVQNPNVFVPADDLIEAVWGFRGGLHRGNITNHIAKVRRALDCDPSNPTFIKTVHARKGYRFIGPVKQITLDGGDNLDTTNKILPSQPLNKAYQFQIASHIFVPLYLGAHVFHEIDRAEKTSQWLRYKEYQIENGRLCILPTGIGVWHLTCPKSFSTLSELAIWRAEFYDEIFRDESNLHLHTNNLLKKGSLSRQRIVEPILGKPGYSYSLIVLQSPRWKSLERTRRVLEILACPKALEPRNSTRSERERIASLERHFLEHGLSSLDMREFGMSGEDLGYASWEGLSYHSLTMNRNEAVETLVEFQIAVHSLWWLSKCVYETCLSNRAIVKKEELATLTADIKKQFLAIKNIEAKESTTQRTMSEAVISVNRVGEMVQEALEAAR